jgi:hypothetical protein
VDGEPKERDYQVKRVDWWFWIPFALGIFLRCAWVWSQPLWYDENFTLAVIRLPWDGFWTAVRGDVHPPLFYLLWRLLPEATLLADPWLLRLPSVLISILTLPLAWHIFGLLASVRTQRMAFALFSLAATGVVFYAQEGRMYALLTLLLLLATWALFECRWVWLGILAVSLLYSQNYGLLYLPALWAAGMLMDPRSWKPLTLSLGLAGLAFLPWIPTLLQQQSSLSGGYWIPPFTPGIALIDLYHAVIQRGAFQFEVFGQLVLFSWISYAFWKQLRLPGDHDILVTGVFVLGFGPWILAFTASLVLGTSIMHYRSLVPCVPFILLWLSYPLTDFQNDKKTLPRPVPDNSNAGSKLRSLPLA